MKTGQLAAIKIMEVTEVIQSTVRFAVFSVYNVDNDLNLIDDFI